MKKRLLFGITAAFLFVSMAKAQTNVQLFYDFGRQYATTTFEMFKGDAWGDSFFFIDHYYATHDDRQAGLGSAYRGSYFEIERGLNFWQDTQFKDFFVHVEYDGATWGSGLASIGARYAFHNDDFSQTASVALMYDYNIGPGSADVPLKFTASIWGRVVSSQSHLLNHPTRCSIASGGQACPSAQ